MIQIVVAIETNYRWVWQALPLHKLFLTLTMFGKCISISQKEAIAYRGRWGVYLVQQLLVSFCWLSLQLVESPSR